MSLKSVVETQIVYCCEDVLLVESSCIPDTCLKNELLFSSSGTICTALFVLFLMSSNMRISLVSSFNSPACSLLISRWGNLGFLFFSRLSYFNPTLRVPSSVHKLAAPHAADRYHALVWPIRIVSCSGIPSSRNSLCPLENPPGNLPSWCLRIEVISSRLYTLALVGIVLLHVELHPIWPHLQS